MQHIENIFSLKGKNVILTGGCGNLGRIMAEGLLGFGATLFIADIADRLPESIAERASLIHCDLTDTASIREMFLKAADMGGSVDVLINNAAYGGGAGGVKMASTRMEDFDDAAWSFGVDGTVGVTFRCIRESIPFFEQNGKGVIVNIASMYGMVAPDHSIYGDTGSNSPVTYGAGKAGVLQLTRYAASYLANKKIRVNAITPGPFPLVTSSMDKTFLSKLQSKTMMGRTGEASELIGPLVLLCSDASSFMTGANIIVDGGWTAW
jgi:gluconate 5-dehydrogenase